MATLLQSPPNAMSLADVRLICEPLADELSQLHWHSEGFSVVGYFSLDGNYLVEYVDGCLQVPADPSRSRGLIPLAPGFAGVKPRRAGFKGAAHPPLSS